MVTKTGFRQLLHLCVLRFVAVGAETGFGVF